MSDPAHWTTPANIVKVLRRRWDDGTLLRAYATNEPFPTIDVPLRGPGVADLGDHFDEARMWADSVRRGSRDGRGYTVLTARVGGRLAGATEVPARALIESYEQAWLLLGAGAAASSFRELLGASALFPPVRAWALASPLAATSLAEDWHAVLAAYSWLDSHRGSGLYLRQVSVPGADTKFIERHRGALAAMLGVPPGASAFTRALGLASKPPTVRLRFDAAALGMPPGLSEAVLRTEELRRLPVSVTRALIVENEVTYLSVPIAPGGVVLWGKGYDAQEPASLEWLGGIDIDYWGDLDTHGFAILNRVRAYLPHARSVLMDRETLLAHEERWGHESAPTDSALGALDVTESALYSDLVTDRYGSGIRLEQERIDWEWAAARLT